MNYLKKNYSPLSLGKHNKTNRFYVSKIFKFIIPILAFIFIFTSCNGDDDNNDNNGLDLNSENTIFEGHWYAIYLSNELEEVGVEIDSLQAIIDDFGVQTPQSTLDAFDEANDTQADLNTDLTAQNAVNANLLGNGDKSIIKDLGPIPPCLCAPVGTENFVVTNEIESIKVTFLDNSGGLIGSFESLNPVPDSEDNLKVVPVNLFGQTESVSMKVEKKDSNGKNTTYQVDNIALQQVINTASQ